jgi:hypothetical protein
MKASSFLKEEQHLADKLRVPNLVEASRAGVDISRSLSI